MNKTLKMLALIIVGFGPTALLNAAVPYRYEVGPPAFGGYFPEINRSPSFAPEFIWNAASDFLSSSFPASLRANIKFRHGCLIEKSKVVEAGFSNDNNFRYFLVYEVSLDQGLVSSYEFALAFSEAGKLLRTPEIPPRINGKDFHFAAPEKIMDAVGKKMENWESSRMEYSNRFRTVLIRFSRFEESWWRGRIERFVFVDACTAEIVHSGTGKVLQ